VRDLDLGGTYVDVGAHHGNHTAYFALECAATRVIAIEPDLESLAGLRETLAENRITGLVDVRPVALHPSWRRASPLPIRWRRHGPDGAPTNTGNRLFAGDPAGVAVVHTLAAPLGAAPTAGGAKADPAGSGG